MCYTGFDGYQSIDICDKITGFDLGTAKKIAEKHGYHINHISVTSPPRLAISEYDDSFRVLRANRKDDKSLHIIALFSNNTGEV